MVGRFYIWPFCGWRSRLKPNCLSLYLEVSEGSGELSHVQSQAPGRASGAVDFLLNILLLRWTPAGERHRQRRAQEHQTGPTSTHDTQDPHRSLGVNGWTSVPLLSRLLLKFRMKTSELRARRARAERLFPPRGHSHHWRQLMWPRGHHNKSGNDQLMCIYCGKKYVYSIANTCQIWNLKLTITEKEETLQKDSKNSSSG